MTNAERLSSSVLRQITFQLRNSEEVKRAIGGGVRYADNWWGEYQSLGLFEFVWFVGWEMTVAVWFGGIGGMMGWVRWVIAEV